MKIVRNIVSIFMVCAMLIMTTGCSMNISTDNQTVSTNEKSAEESAETSAEEVPDTVPDVTQVRSICELATLECRYHNVAKSTKEPGTGLAHIGETARTFWIEYTGVAEISFDTHAIQMTQEGSHITIQLPEPDITCKVDEGSWDENSYVISDDNFIQKNPITAEDQTKAVDDAQVEMEASVRSNSSLIGTAEDQARELIENYINKIGDATGVSYQITWETADAGNQNYNNNAVEKTNAAESGSTSES